MNKRNYQREMDILLEKLKLEEKTPTILLHSCCAPCSSYCLEYLTEYFNIAVFFYNPNISSKEEYSLRLSEQKRLIEEMPKKNSITLIEGEYRPSDFYEIARGLEDAPERGERCQKCYYLRLKAAAMKAKEIKADYFATTLTLSPLKDSYTINSIGERLSGSMDVPYLSSDFKKREGYKRSVELSKEFRLYRQSFCGCVYSKNDSKLL